MTQLLSASTALKGNLYKDKVPVGNFLDSLEDRQVMLVYQDAETRPSDTNSAQLFILPSNWTQLASELLGRDSRQKGNSTEQAKISDEIRKQLFDVFSDAKDEIFESGIETKFSRNLLTIITKYDSAAMDAITDLILSSSLNAEVAAETMRWLGLMESSVCYRQRRWLLARCLRDVSERVRDAASLGLSYLDDPWAIPYVENAIKDERIPELRHDMEQILDQLQNTLESSQ